ncbi:MAG: serine/threonine-protein kinase [Thermoguttaceae bacterium]
MSDHTDPSEDRTASPDLGGRQVGDYRLLRLLGRGAMAEVYLAEQHSLRRRVAVKILKPALAHDPTYLERFRREAQSAAALVHAGIVQIYEVGEQDGLHFIAQEYVQGQNLREWLRRNGPLDLPQALSVMRQVTAALAKAAEAGVVHRDIKPENIMLTADGEVKVADFGLARLTRRDEGLELTQVGITMGTPLYMSPEQVEGKPLDPRSDLYSFGVTCYHLLSGQPPFLSETALGVAVQHVKSEPAPLEAIRPDLPPALCRLVHRMLAKKPAERFRSAHELLQAIRRLHAEHAQPDWPEHFAVWESSGLDLPADDALQATRQLSRLMQNDRRRRSERRLLAAAAAGMFLLGGLTAWYATGSAPLLPAEASNAAPAVPRQDSARAQWFYATTRDTEDAWRAVIEYFPEETHLARRAKQQLARICLLEGRYGEALTIFDELAALGETEAEFRAFGLAGRGSILMLQGKHEASAAVLDQLLPAIDQLRDRQMRQLVGAAVRKNREQLGAQSSRKWNDWLQQQVDLDDAADPE